MNPGPLPGRGDAKQARVGLSRAARHRSATSIRGSCSSFHRFANHVVDNQTCPNFLPAEA
jgi:hypothetical protein